MFTKGKGDFMEIKVFGTGCKKCNDLYEAVESTIKKNDLSAELSKVQDLKEMVQSGVMKTPALMIDGKLVASGRVPSSKELEKLLL